MFARKETHLTPTRFTRDPFGLLRQMTSELDVFDDRFWPSFRWTPEGFTALRENRWSPKVDVFEKDNLLITKIDLPGMKKENVKVEFGEDSAPCGIFPVAESRTEQTHAIAGTIYFVGAR